MAKIPMIFLVILVCMTVLASHHAEAITCQTVVKSLMPCENYLKKGGAVPASCCSGARALNKAANTAAARKTTCECMKVAAKAYKVNAEYAAAVPEKCNVNIAYAISLNTDCNSVR